MDIIRGLFNLFFYAPFAMLLVAWPIGYLAYRGQRTEEQSRKSIIMFGCACVFYAICALVEHFSGFGTLLEWIVPAAIVTIIIGFIAFPVVGLLCACQAIDTFGRIDTAARDVHDMAERDRFRG